MKKLQQKLNARKSLQEKNLGCFWLLFTNQLNFDNFTEF